ARERAATAAILLVEDEAAVRAIAATALRRQGFTVFEAEKPSDACALFEGRAAGVDLLLTDVVMPEMSGPALAQRLISARPDLRVLFMSGYTDVLRPLDIAHPLVGFIAKPFR